MLTESSTETAFEDELAAFRLPSPIVFADEDIFEPEHHLFKQEQEELDLELHIISNINQEITRNPLFYPALIREFGYDSVVPGTDITFRAFAAQHQGAREQELRDIHRLADEYACYETSIFISFLDYWQVTLTWSPYGDASLIRSFTYW